MAVLWCYSTQYLRALLKIDSQGDYVLALTNEEIDKYGFKYKVATFKTNKNDIQSFKIKLTDKVKKFYDIPEDKEYLPVHLMLEPVRAIRGNEDLRKIKQSKAIKDSEESKTIVYDDTLYVVMTEDKKCIVRGRKNTRLVLATIDEKCGNYKIFTCRQHKLAVEQMNKKVNYVSITGNVQDLYGTESCAYDANTMPKLIAVKAQAQYNILL